MDSWFLNAFEGSKSSTQRTTDGQDPLRRFFLGKLKNIPAQLCCIGFIFLQGYLFNSCIFNALSDRKAYLWFIGDFLIGACFFLGFWMREWRIHKLVQMHKDPNSFHKGVPFTSLSWLIYAALIGARIVIIFVHDMDEAIENSQLKLSICLTAVVCVFFSIGHHHQNESLSRQAALSLMIRIFTIDLLDATEILEVLIMTDKKYQEEIELGLERILLAITIMSLARPSLVFFSLFMDHFSAKASALNFKIAKAVFDLLLVNLPLLLARIYMTIAFKVDISVFLIKNCLAVLFSSLELYDSAYDRWEEKNDYRGGKGQHCNNNLNVEPCELQDPTHRESDDQNNSISHKESFEKETEIKA